MSRYFIGAQKIIEQSKATNKNSLTAKRNGMLEAEFPLVLWFSIFPPFQSKHVPKIFKHQVGRNGITFDDYFSKLYNLSLHFMYFISMWQACV